MMLLNSNQITKIRENSQFLRFCQTWNYHSGFNFNLFYTPIWCSDRVFVFYDTSNTCANHRCIYGVQHIDIDSAPELQAKISRFWRFWKKRLWMILNCNCSFLEEEKKCIYIFRQIIWKLKRFLSIMFLINLSHIRKSTKRMSWQLFALQLKAQTIGF